MKQLNIGSGEERRQKKSSNVPGQNLGYSLQHTRFLSRLLNGSSGEKISLEVFEDVGVEDQDGVRTYEQGKSVGLRGNPLADRSVDFWKTFSNWIDAVRKEGLSDRHKFEIYVSKPLSGDICKRFEQASTDKEAKTALEKAQIILLGEELKYSNLSDSIKNYVENVFSFNQDKLVGIIKNFKVILGSGSPQTDLREQLKRALIPEMFIDDAQNWALGLVKKQTDLLLEQQKLAVIEYDWFHAEMTSYNLSLNSGLKLASIEDEISDSIIQTHLYNSIYVKQLELIDADDYEKLAAVNDFLRSSNDRTHWSQKGLVNRKSFAEYETNLIRNWNSLRKIVNIEHRSLVDKERGTLLYHKCSSQSLKLQGLEVPEHFTPGSYHSLSNSKVVGWHPQYDGLLPNI